MTSLIYTTLSLVAAIIVMIVHEIPKSIAYLYLNPLQKMQNRKSIFKLRQYIDPIGLILFVTTGAGFSKPFAYRIKDKKTNLILGVCGFCTNIICILILISMYIIFNSTLDNNIINVYLLTFIVILLKLNISMLLINLLPITPFDMSHIIASKSPSTYFKIYQYEKNLQLLMLVLMWMGFLDIASNVIVRSLI